MKAFLRIGLLAALLGGASYGQRALFAHLQAAILPAGHQQAPAMNVLPGALGAWHGEDDLLNAPRANENGTFRRSYLHAETGQVATLYATYTPAGEPPAGAAEIAEMMGRGVVDGSVPRAFEIVPGVIASQVRTASGPTVHWFFRWSYALQPLHQPQYDALQALHRNTRVSAPHVTIDVFVPDNHPTDPDAAREFVRVADAAIRATLPPGAAPADGRDSYHKLLSN